MTNIAIQPLQWEEIPDISAVKEFSEKDGRCFREVRDVLKKYGALDRFGLTLIHSHFDLADDEILLEETDLETRTQTVRPVKKSEIDEKAVAVTNWKLTEGDAVVMRTCVCARTTDSHLGYHRTA